MSKLLECVVDCLISGLEKGERKNGKIKTARRNGKLGITVIQKCLTPGFDACHLLCVTETGRLCYCYTGTSVNIYYLIVVMIITLVEDLDHRQHMLYTV